MGYIKEKVAYLNGLKDGMNITNEGLDKLFKAMIDTMDAIAEAVETNEEEIDELDECIEDIYDDLDEIEEILFEDDDEEDDDDDDFFCDEDCDGNCDECELKDDFSMDDTDFVECICPECGENVLFSSELIESDEELICPNCNAVMVQG